MAQLPLGLVIKLEEGLETSFKKVHDLNLKTCQVSTYNPNFFSLDTAVLILRLCKEYDITITSLWAGWPGRVVWDFIEGPSTVGLVPLDTRLERCEIMKRAADFATKLAVQSITTHAGFVPEWPSEPLYEGLVESLRDVADYCGERGLLFCLETGQETPITLLRLIEDIGASNMGINFDPANLIMYGKANPIDALGILGSFIQGVHIKDGCYPINGRELGEEKVLGEGQVSIPSFISHLIQSGYSGPLTIERETTGEQQIADIKAAITYLAKVLEMLP
jgi:L-ribulose-5-phosphate 3-epimerase